MKEQIDELTILLLYLTSFKEEYGLSEAQRSWKGYPFESLNELAENNFIRDSKRSKSVYLTDEGIEEAKKLIKKYNIKKIEDIKEAAHYSFFICSSTSLHNLTLIEQELLQPATPCIKSTINRRFPSCYVTTCLIPENLHIKL